jgi:hypothetical protein
MLAAVKGYFLSIAPDFRFTDIFLQNSGPDLGPLGGKSKVNVVAYAKIRGRWRKLLQPSGDYGRRPPSTCPTRPALYYEQSAW